MDSPENPVQTVRRMCSRDGLWLTARPDGTYKHNAGRWTARACGETPDPITYIEYLERNPWLLRR